MAYVLPLLLDGQELETRCPVIYRFPAIVFRFPADTKKKGEKNFIFFFFLIFFKLTRNVVRD